MITHIYELLGLVFIAMEIAAVYLHDQQAQIVVLLWAILWKLFAIQSRQK